MLRAAVAPCGLIYDLLQPEMKTMYYGVDVAYFSPNDIIQFNNACTTAATVTRGDPAVSDEVISFIADRMGVPRSKQPVSADPARSGEAGPGLLFLHYNGHSGLPVNDQEIGAADYCALSPARPLARPIKRAST